MRGNIDFFVGRFHLLGLFYCYLLTAHGWEGIRVKKKSWRESIQVRGNFFRSTEVMSNFYKNIQVKVSSYCNIERES